MQDAGESLCMQHGKGWTCKGVSTSCWWAPSTPTQGEHTVRSHTGLGALQCGDLTVQGGECREQSSARGCAYPGLNPSQKDGTGRPARPGHTGTPQVQPAHKVPGCTTRPRDVLLPLPLLPDKPCTGWGSSFLESHPSCVCPNTANPK